MQLTEDDNALLNGEQGEAAASAMKLLVQYGNAVGAEQFIPVTAAHIDGCMYHGQSGIDFAQRFVDLGARVRIPATLNATAVDCLHPELHQGDPAVLPAQATLTALYVEMGCVATLTCAPYQQNIRPGVGEHIAWAESSAIVFANSVLGARTDRYGDFTDLCAALTGRVPLAGLHIDENRLASVHLQVPAIEASSLPRDLYFACIGYELGKRCGSAIAAITGLPRDASEDELKSLGAAAASSGAIAMFHAVGITPEAPTLEAALPRGAAPKDIALAPADLLVALESLCPVNVGEKVAAICLGSPHYSLAEFSRLAQRIEGRRKADSVEFFVSTSRDIAQVVESDLRFTAIRDFGIQLVTDTCTYLAPVVRQTEHAILTSSAKWAHYGPGNLRQRVGLASLERCVDSAELGQVAAS